MVIEYSKQEARLAEIIDQLNSFQEKVSHCLTCGINLAGYPDGAVYCGSCLQKNKIMCLEFMIIKEDLNDFIRCITDHETIIVEGMLSLFQQKTNKVCNECAACKLINGMYMILEDELNGSINLVQPFKNLQEHFNL